MYNSLNCNCGISFGKKFSMPTHISDANVNDFRRLVNRAVKRGGLNTEITSKQLVEGNPGLFNSIGKVSEFGAKKIEEEYGVTRSNEFIEILSNIVNRHKDGDPTRLITIA